MCLLDIYLIFQLHLDDIMSTITQISFIILQQLFLEVEKHISGGCFPYPPTISFVSTFSDLCPTL